MLRPCKRQAEDGCIDNAHLQNSCIQPPPQVWKQGKKSEVAFSIGMQYITQLFNVMIPSAIPVTQALIKQRPLTVLKEVNKYSYTCKAYQCKKRNTEIFNKTGNHVRESLLKCGGSCI